jgi:penicillin-binding protein 1A
VQGYATLANGGLAIKPYVIDAILGPDGETLYRADPAVACRACEEAGGSRTEKPVLPAPLMGEQGVDPGFDPELQALIDMSEIALTYQPDAAEAPELFDSINAAPRAVSEQNVYIVQDMMRDVVMRGTGRRARALGRTDLSGKTGTSNDRRDAWFGGFNADLATIVWVGYDDDLPLGPGEEGSRTALPIWVEFSRIALDGTPNHQMPMPDGIVTQKINRETGCPARAGETNTMFEIFREGHVPVCEDVEELPLIFKTSDEDIDGEEEEEEEPESLF